MNHLFLELQAREKIEKYRSEGISSQMLAGSKVSRKPRILLAWHALNRLLSTRRKPAPVAGEFAEHPG
jgi:hypothetical protein